MIFYSGFYDFIINFSLLYLVSLIAGFSDQAFLIASALYISSSAIVLQSLIENRKLIFKESEIVIWIMVFEDIAIAVLIILNNPESSEIFLFMAKVLIFTALAYYLSNHIPRTFGGFFSRDDEIPALFVFTLALLGLAFEEFLDIPAGYTAIMLGLMFSEIRKIKEIILPFKDVFLVLFFYFFGISVNVSPDGLFYGILFAITAIIGKILSGIVVGRKTLNSWLSGIEIGFDIARGEFSVFLIFAFGSKAESSAVVIAVIIISIVGSFLAKNSARIREMLSNLEVRSILRIKKN